MKMELRYAARSGFLGGALAEGALGLATNVLREPVFFDGDLLRPEVMRRGLQGLGDVLRSDLKWRPRERSAFRAWLEAEDRRFVASLGMKSADARAALLDVDAQIAVLDGKRLTRRASFEKARAKYLELALLDETELQQILDPVITVHPDEISFEAFSRDQSSYARLGVRYDLFETVRSFTCGTTNVDFSRGLAVHVARLRSYRRSRFSIAPSGIELASARPLDAQHVVREKRIELPPEWMAGFLQVHGLMAMGLTRLRLMPIDVHSLLRKLMTRKAKESPRALRWELLPNAPVKIVIEPWDTVLTCSPESVFTGAKALTVRTWGRDRLRTLGELLPIASHIDVFLAGTGLPSVWCLDLGQEATFTLALSGWTDNDWVEGPARFDLLGRRVALSSTELGALYAKLREDRKGTDEQLAQSTGLPLDKVRSGLSILCQSGRAMIDLSRGVYRHRDLLLEPFDPSRAAALVKKAELASDPRAKDAEALFTAGEARIIARRPFSGGHKLSGNVKDGATRARPQIVVDLDGKIVEASCTCHDAQKHGLTKGPCVHMLALRRAHEDRAAKEAAMP
jgi:hypothetical protein